MGHVFQVEWLERHPSGCSFGFLWLRKLAKAIAKALKRQKGILAHLFMKIMEIRRKMKVKGHILHVRKKLKENNGK